MKFALLFSILFSYAFFPCYAKDYKYDISVAAIFQNEARFIKEWIDYNVIIGVEHFVLYNNESSDDYYPVLKPYIESGIVELHYWPDLWPEVFFSFGCQSKAYEDAILRMKDTTNWLALIDLDEFILPRDGKELTHILNKDFKKNDAVCVYWQKFGTNHVDNIGDGLMIAQLTARAKEDHPCNMWFKSIVKPRKVKRFPNPHFAIFKGKGYAVNTKKQRIPKEISHETEIEYFTTDLIRINHYWTRDKHFMLEVKKPRYEKFWNSDLPNFLDQYDDLNEVYDNEIFRFVYPLLILSYPCG